MFHTLLLLNGWILPRCARARRYCYGAPGEQVVEPLLVDVPLELPPLDPLELDPLDELPVTVLPDDVPELVPPLELVLTVPELPEPVTTPELDPELDPLQTPPDNPDRQRNCTIALTHACARSGHCHRADIHLRQNCNPRAQ